MAASFIPEYPDVVEIQFLLFRWNILIDFCVSLMNHYEDRLTQDVWQYNMLVTLLQLRLAGG